MTKVTQREYYVTRNVVEPTEGYSMIRKDRWWWCKNGDPKEAVFFRSPGSKEMSAQCNSNKELLEAFGKPYPECEAVFIKISYEYLPNSNIFYNP